MAEYIESLGFDIVRNDRTIIKPQELDVYIPSEQVAFEYNGEYWHSKHPEGYHEGKTLVCARAGVTLIHIWEKEWLKDLEEARALIRKTLNVYQRPSTRSIKPAS